MSFQESFSDKLPLFLILSIGHFSGIQTNLQNPFNIRLTLFMPFTQILSPPHLLIFTYASPRLNPFFFKINIHKCNVPLDYRNIWKMVERIKIFSHNGRAINYMQKRHDLFPFIRAKHYNMSQCMRFPTMWYVRPAKPPISLRIRAV